MKRAGLAFQGRIGEDRLEGLAQKSSPEVPGGHGVFGQYLKAVIG
jgi:hypothetical protein